MMGPKHTSGSRARGLTTAVSFAALLGFAGCDGLLDVEVPGQVTEEDALAPGNAETAVLGVIANFEHAFSEFVAAMSGHESVYWRTSSLYNDYAEFAEPRPDAGGYYTNWQASRALAEQMYDRLSTWTDEEVADRRELMATAATFAGLAYQYLGEVYCELAVNVGPLMTPTQTLKEGEVWFTRALEQTEATGDFSYMGVPSMDQLAHLGRARVRFALGTHYADPGERAQYLAGAAADAAMIEPGFVAYVTREGSVESRWNNVYDDHTFNNYGTIAGRVPDPSGLWVEPGGFVPFTGYRYLIVDNDGNAVIDGNPVMEERPLGQAPTTGVADPRVPVVIDPGNMGLEGVTQVYLQQKYESRDDEMIFAKWAEAQLMLAEIEARASNGTAAIAHIDNLRRAHELPEYEGPATTWENGLREVIIEERRREFFLEGRFWADKLRYDLWFPRGQGLAVPEGRGSYGPVTCALMPLAEYDVNPNVDGDGSQHHNN